MTQDNSMINKLKSVLPSDQVLTGTDLEDRYHHIWKMDEPLKARCLVMPKTTEEASKILALCNASNTPVVMHGGLTNLVGGTESQGREVVLSLEKMNKISAVDTSSRTLTVEAGCILQSVQQAALDSDLLFPLNFGAKGSAQIGGIISTNAGGLRVLKYGMTRQLILGLEAVLADGTVISSLKTIIKDNSGYDLKQLFIGSEGTLGVVTKAVLKLVEVPQSRCSAMVALDDYGEVVNLLKTVDKSMGGSLTGYELMWNNYYRLATTPPALNKPPLPSTYKYYVLIEVMGQDQKTDSDKLESVIQGAFESGMIKDAAFAHTQSDLDWFWSIREDVHAGVSQLTYDQHFDISLPVPVIGSVCDEIIDKLVALPYCRGVITFGHVADGNIHFIVGKTHQSPEIIHEINEIIYSPLKVNGGSISAEHGIGLHKKAYLHHCRSEAEIKLMETMKKALDPNGILNPGKIL